MANDNVVFWPDLSRFGARLSVVFNPSLKRNFLKLSVLDLGTVAAESGLPAGTDLLQVLRDFDFVPDHAELDREVLALREKFQQADGLQDESGWTEIARVQNRVGYFYSPTVSVSKKMLSAVFPAITDADFRQMPVDEVKQVDVRVLSPAGERGLLTGQQPIEGGEAGVLYVTAADRALIAELATSVSDVATALNKLRRHDDGAAAALAGLFPLDVTRVLLSRGAMLPDGSRLRGIPAAALAMGYPSREVAIAANGGVADGIEEVKMPFSLPLAIDPSGKRVLAVADARFLEFTHTRFGGVFMSDIAADILPANNVFHLFDELAKLKAGWQEVVAMDGMNQESWTHERLEALAPRLEALSKGLLAAGTVPGRSPVSVIGGGYFAKLFNVTPERFRQVMGNEFSQFIDAADDMASQAKRKLESFEADAAAKRGLEEALSVVGSKPTEATQRREDAGEKIGGARKDYAARWLSASEVGDMTPSEWKDIVSKDNVWPAIDYRAMKEDGVDPTVAWLIKEMRGALPVNPYRGGYNAKRNALARRSATDLTQKQCEDFVGAVALVRDAMKGVRTVEDFKYAVWQLRRDAGLNVYESDGKYFRSSGSSWDGDTAFGDGAGFNFCVKAVPDIYVRNGEIVEELSFDRFVAAARTKTGNGWDWAIKDKSPRKKPDAEKVKKPEPEWEHLASIERVGPDYRQGKDVDEDMLMKVLGFRSIEYGNWLPQGERQHVLNHAFDAFMDLAAVMKLPPRAVSLGGELAIAFGARGNGGRQAARAHFEPGRFVINLTRLAGAGCLAHEWGHALDSYLSKVVGASQMRLLTEFHGQRMNRSEPVVEGVFRVMDVATRRPMTREEMIRARTSIDSEFSSEKGQKLCVSAHAERAVRHWTSWIRAKLPESVDHDAFDSFRDQVIAQHFQPSEDPELAAQGVKRFIEPELFLQSLQSYVSDVIPDIASTCHLNVCYPRSLSDWLNKVVTRAENQMQSVEFSTEMTDTRFVEDAKFFDGFRSKPYWATSVELFARSFESWVQARIEKSGTERSQYLVHGCLPSEAVEHSGWPRGADRESICQAFDRLFTEHRPQLLRMLKADHEISRLSEPVPG